MNHDLCARWARSAPGAIRAWYAENPGKLRAERDQIRAWLLDVPAPSVLPETRGVWAPFILQPRGTWPEGVLVQVRAGAFVGATTVPVPPPLVEQAWRWVCGLCEVRALPVPTRVGYVDPPEGVSLAGDSPGLAVAVALLAHVLERAPRAPVVASASVDHPARAHIATVDWTEEKRRVCAVEAPGAGAFVADADADVAPLLAQWFGPTWHQDLARVLGASSWRLATDAWNANRAGRHAESEPLAEAAIRMGGAERSLAYAWLARGACRLHRGETSGALADMDEAERRLALPHAPDDEPPDPWEREELLAHVGVALVDSGRPLAAVERLEGALAQLLTASQPDKAWRLVTLQVAGTLHRARVLAGDLPGARDALERVALGAARHRAERARCLGDLAEVLRRQGDLAGARARLEEAARELVDADPDARARTARFQRLYRVRAGLEASSTAIEAPNWRDWPQPAEVLEALLAGRGDLDAWMDAHGRADAEGNVIRSLFYLGVGARRGGPTPAWAVAIADALAGLPGVEPGVAELALTARANGLAELGRRAPY